MADSLSTEILKQVCYNREKLIVGFAAVVVFLLVTLIGFTVLDPDTATYTINVVNLVTLTVLSVVAGGLLALCYKSDVVYR